MSDSVKVAGLFGSMMVCMAALYLGEVEFAYGSASMFGAILGLPVIGRTLQKIFR